MERMMPREFDTIVVGSGPGGGTVAREMSRRGHRVLILERGPNRPISGTARQMVRELMIPGKSLLITPRLLAMVRGLTAGGSSGSGRWGLHFALGRFDPFRDLVAILIACHGEEPQQSCHRGKPAAHLIVLS